MEQLAAAPSCEGAAETAPSQAVAAIAIDCAPHAPPDKLSDEVAGRHGQDALRALSGLHLALLDGSGDAARATARATLASLADALPTASDPKLEAVLRAIAQRAAIELARP